MRSPWHSEQPRDHQLEQKTLFGNLIERSTSAPPKSTDHSILVNNRSFLGNDNSSVSVVLDTDCTYTDMKFTHHELVFICKQ
jgi:hypothetical protein